MSLGDVNSHMKLMVKQEKQESECFPASLILQKST